MDEKVFIQGINLIETAIQKEFSKEQIKLYKMLLNDVEDKQFVEGIVKLLKERVYTNIPAAAEIREYCLDLKENDFQFKIAEARNSIKKAISQYGTYRNVCFDDPVIHAIIKSMGGWTKVCACDIEEFNDYLKWELPKLYKTYATRKIEIDLFLTGIGYDNEKQNKIYYIGDKEKIDRWHVKYLEKNKNKLTGIEFNKAKELGLIKPGEVFLCDNSNDYQNKEYKDVNCMIEDMRRNKTI